MRARFWRDSSKRRPPRNFFPGVKIWPTASLAPRAAGPKSAAFFGHRPIDVVRKVWHTSDMSNAVRNRLQNLQRRRANSPTRAHCLALARAVFGPLTHFIRTEPDATGVQGFAVTVKLPGKDHNVLGTGGSWLAAIKSAQDDLGGGSGTEGQAPAEGGTGAERPVSNPEQTAEAGSAVEIAGSPVSAEAP